MHAACRLAAVSLEKLEASGFRRPTLPHEREEMFERFAVGALFLFGELARAFVELRRHFARLFRRTPHDDQHLRQRLKMTVGWFGHGANLTPMEPQDKAGVPVCGVAICPWDRFDSRHFRRCADTLRA
jgi:hypothetical protein